MEPTTKPKRPSRRPGLGHAAAMVVEPNPTWLTAVRQTLEAMGFTVLAARSLDEGKQIAATFGGGPMDLVVADLSPRKHSADELQQALRKGLSGLPVLYTSGETDPASPEPPGRPRVAVLPKPFREEELAVRLQSLLGVCA